MERADISASSVEEIRFSVSRPDAHVTRPPQRDQNALRCAAMGALGRGRVWLKPAGRGMGDPSRGSLCAVANSHLPERDTPHES
jgi:hypothetical protein